MSDPTLSPHNLDAERAVLGAVLIDPACLYDLDGIVSADDFFLQRHGWLWDAYISLRRRGSAIDYLTVVNQLESDGHLEAVGGGAFILDLLQKVPTSLHADSYACIVEELSLRRQYQQAAQDLNRIAHSGDLETDDLVAEAERTVLGVGQRRQSGQDITSYFDLINDEFDRQQYLARPENKGALLDGARTYLPVDDLLNVVPNGEILYVAARPAMGKTSALTQIVAESARAGLAAGMLSLEMSADQMRRRLASYFAGLNTQRLDRGELTPYELQSLTAHLGADARLPIFVNDTPGVTPAQLRSIARRMVRQYGVRVIALDYIQLMRGGAGFRAKENRNAELTYISQEIKITARELGIPFIVASQLSRDCEKRSDKRPLLSDLRDSGSLEQDAFQVVMLYRDSYYNENTMDQTTEFLVRKNRNGPTGTRRAMFEAERVKFYPVEERKIDLAADERRATGRKDGRDDEHAIEA